MPNTVQSVEQDVADALFKKSGLVLSGDYVNNVLVGFDVTVRGTRTGRLSPFARRGPLKIVLTVGGWDNDKARTFRERQNGTFNIAKIVDRLIEERNYKVDKLIRRKNKDKTRGNAAQCRNLALSLLGGGRSEYSSTVNVTRFDQLESKIVLKATEENAEKLAKILAYAEELGVIV